MALPKINRVGKEIKTPITKQKVKVFPLTLKDQKSIENVTDIASILIDLVKACTTAEIDSLDPIELQWLFLQIKKETSGPNIPTRIKCTSCNIENDVNISIDEYKVTPPKELPHTIIVDKSQNIGIKLQKVKLSDALVKAERSSTEVIRLVIESIFDENDVYKVSSVNDEELIEFIDSLPADIVNSILEWMYNVGSLTLSHDWTCSSCGTLNSIRTEGINEQL